MMLMGSAALPLRGLHIRGVPTMLMSARTGEGLEQWRDWLGRTVDRAAAPA